ncbi:MAG: ABC-F family ATP-binding cassette domain-containing protein [Deltaproteobacteria bacterium]|nr:ABC-F family ATP-binding cassette domain-containing protein [Deltaproteobacteria bacterium]
MIDALDLRKSYGPQSLLAGASFKISPGEHLGLVGPNGSGKTTLLRLLAGEESPDAGEVARRRGLSVGYLTQELEAGLGVPLRTYVEDVAEELRSLEEDLRDAEARLARGEHDPQLLERYGLDQARFEHLGGYRLGAEAERILAGLGFREDDFDRPLSSFSGGWRMRGALARLLLSRPDLILLDEPTNHLDIVTLEWLETFLQESPGAYLVVSHDVSFLDRVVTGVLALEGGRVVRSKGNYAAYTAERAVREEQARATRENQLRRRAETEAFVERFRAKASKARQVQARVKQLDREPVATPPPIATPPDLRLVLPQPSRSGRTVASLEGVDVGYGERVVYRGLDFRVDRDERVVLIGPNGAGKSTLLKVLAGQVQPSAGRLTYGHNVTVSYFAQHQLDQLDPSRTVLEEMRRLPGLRSELELRSLLGAFLFSGEAVEKKVEVLSGGEKSRLVLAKLLACPGNFLLMDEPTNHLDLHACAVLKEALAGYEGTLCLITHDRDLINRVASRVVYVDAGQARSYLGTFDDFARKRADEAELLGASTAGRRPDAPAPGGARREQRRLDAERRDRARRETGPLRRRVEALEAEIGAAEVRATEVERRLADPATYADPRAAGDLGREQTALRRSLETLTASWEEAATALEDLERRLEAEGP